MVEYIEREAVMPEVDSAVELYPSEYDAISNKIDQIPAADVVEVVHGEWKTKPNTGGYEVCMRCSVCGFQFDNWKHIFNYCPSCGAKMNAGNKPTLPETTRQTVLNSFMKDSDS